MKYRNEGEVRAAQEARKIAMQDAPLKAAVDAAGFVPFEAMVASRAVPYDAPADRAGDPAKAVKPR